VTVNYACHLSSSSFVCVFFRSIHILNRSQSNIYRISYEECKDKQSDLITLFHIGSCLKLKISCHYTTLPHVISSVRAGTDTKSVCNYNKAIERSTNDRTHQHYPLSPPVRPLPIFSSCHIAIQCARMLDISARDKRFGLIDRGHKGLENTSRQSGRKFEILHPLFHETFFLGGGGL
jgi:hypothetical protein